MATTKTTPFLTWAREQAKQHGANSKISNLSKLTSKYIIGDFTTWAEVIKAGEADLRDQGRKPDAPIRVKPKTAKDLKLQITQLATIAEHQQNANDRLDVNSQEYKDGVARLKETNLNLATAKTEYDKILKEEKAVTQRAKNDKDIASQVKQAKSDLADLQDERQRAADMGNDTTKLDQQIKDAENKLNTLVPPQSPLAGQAFPALPGTTGGTTQGPKAVTPVAETPKIVPPAASGTGTSSTVTPPKGAVWDGKKWVLPAATPVPSQADFLAKYGTTLAFIQSDPSLTALFNAASKAGWDGPRFQAELKNTTWAAKYAAGAQAVELSRTQSPASYADSYNRMRELVAQTAVSMGEAINPQDVGSELVSAKPGIWTAVDVPQDNSGSITIWAMQHVSDSNFIAALQTYIANRGKINLALPGGLAAKDNMDLKAYAGQMGIGNLALPPSNDPSKMGQDYFSSASQSILLGKSTIDTWKADLLQKAKDTYKAFAPSLDAGQSVQNLAAPYINTLANLLEIPTGQIDLSASTGYGKMVHDALVGNDPANQKPMALYDFEKLVKSRPEWGMTNNARDTIMGGVGSLLKSFGKVS